MKFKKFTVVYSDCTVNIETKGHQDDDDFFYANMKNCYTTGHGHGLQSNDPNNDDDLMIMCDKIASAIYEFEEKKAGRDEQEKSKK